MSIQHPSLSTAATQPTRPTPQDLGSFKQVASHWQVEHTERSLRYWFHEGKIKGYRITGRRQILISLGEVIAYANRRRDYGPNAQVVELPARPIIVDDGLGQ